MEPTSESSREPSRSKPAAPSIAASDLAALHDRLRRAATSDAERYGRPDGRIRRGAMPWMVVWVAVIAAAMAIVIATLEIQ